MIYSKFAWVYDNFMSDVDYDKWVKNVLKIWRKYGISPELALDLCCGTGNVTERLHDLGISMIGVDMSVDMLMVAKEKADNLGKDILYINQDITELELFGTVDAMVCLCDGMNYILDKKMFLKAFKIFKNYLNPGGIFIFDMNTEHKFKNIFSNNAYSFKNEDSAYIWENYYDAKSKKNEYNLSLFIANSDEPSIYERFDEVHYERAYSIEEIKALAEKAGLEFLFVYDANSLKSPSAETERYLYGLRNRKG